jgi:hypothetical protein
MGNDQGHCDACGLLAYRSTGGEWWHNATHQEVVTASRAADVPAVHRVTIRVAPAPVRTSR